MLFTKTLWVRCKPFTSSSIQQNAHAVRSFTQYEEPAAAFLYYCIVAKKPQTKKPPQKPQSDRVLISLLTQILEWVSEHQRNDNALSWSVNKAEVLSTQNCSGYSCCCFVLCHFRGCWFLLCGMREFSSYWWLHGLFEQSWMSLLVCSHLWLVHPCKTWPQAIKKWWEPYFAWANLIIWE